MTTPVDRAGMSPQSPRELVTTVRLDPILIESARSKAGLPAGTGIQALIRYALARLADWPDEAALVTARISRDHAG
jgi:hypothetical protein